jgi:hypothetical protein
VFVAGIGPQTASVGIQGASILNYTPSTGTLTTTDFNSTSDIKLKTNIKQVTDALIKILKLKGVTFNWIETNKPSVGVIAQDVEKVLPELVNQSDPKSVNYDGLIGLVIEAIREQQEQINILKKEIERLK